MKTNKALKACGYARVAKGEGSHDTIEMQKADFMAYMLRNNLEYAGVYFDVGVPAHRTSKRHGFLQMLADCRAGKINKIICKSISRFSRNTMDCYMVIREMRELGVSIYFQNENIDTLTPGGAAILEMLATIDADKGKLPRIEIRNTPRGRIRRIIHKNGNIGDWRPVR